MVQSSSPIPFEAFFIPYTTTISLNWPYEPRDCLLPTAPASASSNPGVGSDEGRPQTPGAVAAEEQWMINPAFESHLRNLGNWSLGPGFRDAFPELAEAVRIREGR